MKPEHQAHIDFIKTCLRNGEKRNEILAKFSERWRKIASRTFDRRLKDAQIQLEIEQGKIKQQLEEGIKWEVEARKSKILSPLDRQEWLSKIIKSSSNKELGISISTDNRIRAIAELNKMGGDYAPERHQITGDIEPVIYILSNGKEIVM